MRLPLLFLALLAASAVEAQESPYTSDFIVGVQSPDGAPIAGATVLVGERGASTDADGEAVIEGLRPGRHVVRVSFLGYEPRELAARLEAPGPWGLIVELAEAAVALDEVVVSATDLSRSRLAQDGFFDRQKFGHGTVLTIDDLERRNPILLGDALMGVLGVRVRRNSVRGLGGGTPGRTAVSVRFGAECPMDVFLDGFHSPFLSENIDAITAHDVVAIEVYRGPTQIPVAYNRLGQGGACGVVLVWTSRSLAERG